MLVQRMQHCPEEFAVGLGSVRLGLKGLLSYSQERALVVKPGSRASGFPEAAAEWVLPWTDALRFLVFQVGDVGVKPEGWGAWNSEFLTFQFHGSGVVSKQPLVNQASLGHIQVELITCIINKAVFDSIVPPGRKWCHSNNELMHLQGYAGFSGNSGPW
eukprot:s53_g9.t1